MVFWSLFNYDWKIAAQIQKFKFPVVFASFDTLLDPMGAKVIEIEIMSKIALFEMILKANTPVCCWNGHFARQGTEFLYLSF